MEESHMADEPFSVSVISADEYWNKAVYRGKTPSKDINQSINNHTHIPYTNYLLFC